MLANYLTISVAVLAICSEKGLASLKRCLVARFSVTIAAFFALTPGFGGFLLAAGLLLALRWRKQGGIVAAKAAKAAAIAGGLLLTSAAIVTPIINAHAPFLIPLPGLIPLAPSVRLLAWIDAVQNFVQSPLFGLGVGTAAVDVRFTLPSGDAAFVTDAHNMFLNIAAQCGLVGIAGLMVLIIGIWWVGFRGRPGTDRANLISYKLTLGLLCAFVLEGLVGSFEDARHIWVVIGLILSASMLEGEGVVRKRDHDATLSS